MLTPPSNAQKSPLGPDQAEASIADGMIDQNVCFCVRSSLRDNRDGQAEIEGPPPIEPKQPWPSEMSFCPLRIGRKLFATTPQLSTW